MVKRKVIQLSTSSWASPILLADKKNGKIQFCVDFCHLNNVTKKDAYPLPRMDTILGALGNSSYFSSIDLTDVFWSILIQQQDVEKTAFTSKYGLWEFLSMPFELCNAPATQQHYIEAVLNGFIWRYCFAYVDDIICFSNSFEKHLEDLRDILERLKEHNLILQPLKCSFCKPTFEILDFVATKDGLSPNPKKVKAIQNYSLPKSPKEVEIFIEMVTWLKRFIPNLSKLTFHLRKAKTLKESRFFLSEKAEEEFQILKDILKKETCVAHSDLSKRFFIHVDASS